MNIDLNSLDLKELKMLKANVDKCLANFEDRKRREALAELEMIARENGYSLQDLVGGGFPGSSASVFKSKRAPATPKYFNPSNKSDTWSGRGRKPLWFEAALKSGKKPEQMAIQATH